MNERIRELAEQATTITYEEDGWRLYGTEVETFNKEKFAELIVRECANAIQTEKDTGLYNAQQMAGMTVSKTVIKDHFGVEE